MTNTPSHKHLPASAAEIRGLGWDAVDVLLVTGDAHVDHPAFPAGLLGRVLQAAGHRVAVVPRPDPNDPGALAQFGVPRLFLGVTAGALDSMVANYTALNRRRRDDPYAPGGKGGGRPDRALTVYCNLARRAFGKQALIVAGGLEASLRRFGHYDYWSDSVRRPILMDCGADVLVFGMGEGPLLKIAAHLAQRPQERTALALADIPGVVWRQPLSSPEPDDSVALPSYEEVAADPGLHAAAYQSQQAHRDRRMWQACGGMRVVANRPWPAPEAAKLDAWYGLPFARDPHPMYQGRRIPALEQVRFSATSHRGCFGGCAFCALSAHQGKEVASRSRQSVLDEVLRIVSHPGFKGTIPDIGGPTANMYGSRCTSDQPCSRPSCLWPSRCSHLETGQEAYLQLLKDAASIPGVKNLFVTTGIRMDLALECRPLLEALAFRHTSGHLKVAPEHVSKPVLALMRKPGGAFLKFIEQHRLLSRQAGKQQYVVPYLMAAHPGSRLEDMVEVALFLHRHDIRVEQCQIFTPTPGTSATVMYATGLNPATMEPVFVERDPERKKLQKALLLYRLPENAGLVAKALAQCGRGDLLPTLVPRSRR